MIKEFFAKLMNVNYGPEKGWEKGKEAEAIRERQRESAEAQQRQQMYRQNMKEEGITPKSDFVPRGENEKRVEQ